MAYKIIVPKAGTANEEGTESKLYTLDEVVETTAQWQKDLMEVFLYLFFGIYCSKIFFFFQINIFDNHRFLWISVVYF